MADNTVARHVRCIAHALDGIQNELRGRDDSASRDLSTLLYGFAEKFLAAFHRVVRDGERQRARGKRWTPRTLRRHPRLTG